MLSDLDVYRAAHLMLHQYGDDRRSDVRTR